jgi:hypothetical protein
MEANPQPVSVLAPQLGNSERRSKMILPAPRCIMCGTTALQQWKMSKTLTRW